MIVWDGIALVALAIWGVVLIGTLLFYWGLRIYDYFYYRHKNNKKKNNKKKNNH